MRGARHVKGWVRALCVAFPMLLALGAGSALAGVIDPATGGWMEFQVDMTPGNKVLAPARIYNSLLPQGGRLFGGYWCTVYDFRLRPISAALIAVDTCLGRFIFRKVSQDRAVLVSNFTEADDVARGNEVFYGGVEEALASPDWGAQVAEHASHLTILHNPDGSVAGYTKSNTWLDITFSPDGRVAKLHCPGFPAQKFEEEEATVTPNWQGDTLTGFDYVNAAGAKSSFSFVRDAHGRVTNIQSNGANIVTYEYNAAGDIVAVDNQWGNRWPAVYDDAHRLIELPDPYGHRSIVYGYRGDTGYAAYYASSWTTKPNEVCTQAVQRAERADSIWSKVADDCFNGTIDKPIREWTDYALIRRRPRDGYVAVEPFRGSLYGTQCIGVDASCTPGWSEPSSWYSMTWR